jgi:hypothetical protein
MEDSVMPTGSQIVRLSIVLISLPAALALVIDES